MTNLERILTVLANHPEGLDDDELSQLAGVNPRQQVYQLCQRLAAEGRIRRTRVSRAGKRRKIHSFLMRDSCRDEGGTGAETQRPPPTERRLAALQAVTGKTRGQILEDALRALAMRILAEETGATPAEALMGQHDEYGKAVLRGAAGSAFSGWGTSVEVPLGVGRPARVDGTVDDVIAIEVESRTAKQVRGALMDLVLHPYPKKLLVLIPVHMSDAETLKAQCDYILGKFVESHRFRVVVLEGTGDRPSIEADVEGVRKALFNAREN